MGLLFIRVLGGVAASVLLVATWPQAVGLQRAHVFAQLTAMRGFMILAALALGLLLSYAAWRFRPLRRLATALVVVLVVVIAANVGVLAYRGLNKGATTAGGPGTITLLAWNTLTDAPDAHLIAEFAVEHGAQVLALSETSAEAAEEIAGNMAAAGQSMQVFALDSPSGNPRQSTALLVATQLGEYALDLSVGSTPRVMTVVAKPVQGDGPTLVSTHAAPPSPTQYEAWLQGLQWLAERCRQPNLIVAGDFNSTLEHFVGLQEPGADLGACRDGARALGAAALGTWPAWVPLLLGSPIDHVMATPEWEFLGFRVATELDGTGSDHRALLATLRRVQ